MDRAQPDRTPKDRSKKDRAAEDRAADFDSRFRRALRRLRWRSVMHGVATSLPWLLGIWLVLFIVGRAGYPLLPRAWVFGGLAMSLVARIAWRLRRAPTGRNAALVLDHCLGSRELVTAAHEDEAQSPIHPLARLARQRAANALAPVKVAKALPLPPWRGWRPALLGLVAAVLALALPVRQAGIAAAVAIGPVVEKVADQLAEELEPLTEAVATMERPQAEEALARLQELVDEMQQGELPTVDDALVALSQLEQTLRELTRPQETQGFNALVEDLAGEPLSADLAQAMTEGDREALRQTLERLGEALTGPEANDLAMQRQVERLQQRLAELAELLAASGETELAAAVRELAEALAAGDLDKARELLESSEVAGACQVGGDRAGEGKLGNQLAELLQLGRFLLGQGAGEGGSVPAQGEGPPSSSRSGRGPHPGSQTTNREADGYESGDAILRDRRSEESAGWQEEFEALYGSRLGRGEGEELRIKGQVGAEGELLSQTGRGLGITGEGSLPLRPFASAAGGDAERATDLESVPLSYRGLVRRYFERNPEPSTTPGSASEGGGS